MRKVGKEVLIFIIWYKGIFVEHLINNCWRDCRWVLEKCILKRYLGFFFPSDWQK